MTTDARIDLDAAITEANAMHGRKLADFGFTLQASGAHGYELTHPAGFGHGWSADYYPQIAGTLSLFLSGVETGTAMARAGVKVTTSGDRYTAAMTHAAEIWLDIIDGIRAAGFKDADITQTGGMCLAIEVPLSASRYALVTDFEDILPWERSEHRGFSVGIYSTDDDAFEDGEMIYCEPNTDPAPMIAALVAYREEHPS